MTRPYCSLIARDAREPLAGTASHAQGCLLLSYPKRMWARDTMASEGMPRSLLDAIERLAQDHGVVTRLLAHEGEWRGRVELTLFPQARRHQGVPIDEVARLLDSASQGDGELVRTPIVAVCTHGVRDRCCALFGGELVRALALVGDPDVEIREASHLGGDRFAPTVLVLPSGHMYGHLTPDDAPALIAAALGRSALRERFRGSLWLDPLEQMAQIAAVELAAREGRDEVPALGPIARTDHGRDRSVLRCSVALGEASVDLEITCVREHRLVVGDCRSADRGREGSVHVWRIASKS